VYLQRVRVHVRVYVQEFGADVDARGLQGQTAMHVAAEQGEDEAIRILSRLGPK
jgi:ankyrin repeat protein